MTKNVLLVSGMLAPSGSTTWLFGMYDALRMAGAEVTLLVLSKKGSIQPKFKEVIYTGRPRDNPLLRLTRWLQLHKLFPRWFEHQECRILDARIRRIVGHMTPQIDMVIKDSSGRLPKALAEYPVVAVIHSNLATEPADQITNYRIQPARHFVPVSNTVRKDAERLGFRTSQPIYNPLNIENILNSSLEFVPDISTPFILFVGRLVKGKGVLQLLQAYAKLDTTATLVYVGSGSCEMELREEAAKLGVTERVYFAGYQRNPYPWMRHAACLVLPTTGEFEAMGYAPIEAAALGCNIIVAGFPAAYEFFNHEIIVPRRPLESYVDRLRAHIAASLQGKKTIGLQDGVLEKMEPRSVAQQYLNLILDNQGQASSQ